MLAQESRDQARVDIIGTTGVGADNQFYLLVLEEVVRVRGVCTCKKNACRNRHCQYANMVVYHLDPIPDAFHSTVRTLDDSEKGAKRLSCKQPFTWAADCDKIFAAFGRGYPSVSFDLADSDPSKNDQQ